MLFSICEKSNMDSIRKIVYSGHNVYILGAAGTGKTWCPKTLLNEIKDKKGVGVTATTGLVAKQFAGGMTVHRYVMLPLHPNFKIYVHGIDK